jgi:hypothetical protein
MRAPLKHCEQKRRRWHLGSVPQKVVMHNDHLKQDFYNQYDQRLKHKTLRRRLGCLLAVEHPGNPELIH